MHATFRFQPPIGILALDMDGCRFNPCLFPVMALNQLNLVSLGFCPPRIHAQQHRGPVLALGPPGAGVNFDICFVGVGFAGQKCHHTLTPCLGTGERERGFSLCNNLVVTFSLTHLDQFQIIVERGFEREVGLDGFIKLCSLAHQGLRLLRVVPNARVLRFCVQFIHSFLGAIPVKDASSARPTSL